ncbi:MAG: hypothetical protein LBS19_16220 [Clostridiales bacterium]|jgi:hypothetical protein|nr:hypothetical protein [Clostridiales bacterium]
MELRNFQKILEDFKNADTDEKIDIYVNTDGLTQQQYKELLRLFPMNELYRLEEALT